jgi:hypothetical protein
MSHVFEQGTVSKDMRELTVRRFSGIIATMVSVVNHIVAIAHIHDPPIAC